MGIAFVDRLEGLASELRDQSNSPRLGTLLWFLYANELLIRHLESDVARMGINRTKANILYLLTTNGGTMTPTKLSNKVLRSKHAITMSIDSLVREGLIKRETEDEDNDRRFRKVSITGKGLSFVKKTMPTRAALADRVFSCFDDDDCRILSDSLQRLKNHLQDSIGDEDLQKIDTA